MRYFLVCNPGSRAGKSGRLIEIYRRLLASSGAEFEYEPTRSMEDAEAIASVAARNGAGTVVAVGGDGTINRVINGICGSGAAMADLGVLYAGTSPDFCRFHGIPTNPELAVEALLSGRTAEVDLCAIETREIPDAGGKNARTFFGCSSNTGLGAGVAERSNRYRGSIGDFAGTLLATFTTLVSSRGNDYTITIDGEKKIFTNVLNITVGKNPYIASGLKLDIDIARDDGFLYYFIISGIGKASFLFNLPRVYTGDISRDRRFLVGKAHQVEIEPEGCRVQTEFDGDAAGWCPARIKICPRAIRLRGVQ